MISLNKENFKFELFLYLTLGSIFLTNFKLYIPLFFLNILYVGYLVLKKEIKINFSKWNKSLILFIVWFFVNSVLAILFIKNPIDIMLAIKLLLNLTYLLSMGLILESEKFTFNKSNFISFLKFIIIINFVQIMTIYIKGGLFSEFIKGNLTGSSDAAYIVSYFNNIVGGDNKNIWASKFTFIFLIYLYTCIDISLAKLQSKIVKISYVGIGTITILLLLSRTSQLAVIVPIIFMCFMSIKNINKKYKIAIYSIVGVGIVGVLVIFFSKLFHIKFDMTDGGYTRLYIWVECLKDAFSNNLIIGAGIGSSADYIQGVIGRFESNTHNVFITMFYEFGVVGLLMYSKAIFELLKSNINREEIVKVIFIILIPVFIIMNLQYLGYDNDIVVFLILLLIGIKIKRNEELNYE